MYTATATLRGTTSYMFSKVIKSDRVSNETGETFEQRTWRERIHTDSNGYAQVPSRAVKGMLIDTAKFIGDKIPGRGQSTYTKRFESGVRAAKAYFPMYDFKGERIEAAKVPGTWHFVPSDGKPGGGKRVWKCFPEVEEWAIDIELLVLDEIIEPSRLLSYLKTAGAFKGLGSWRPGKAGEHGAFIVVEESFVIQEMLGAA